MRRLKEILRIVLPLTLGVLIFWWVYRKLDFSEIVRILQNGVSYGWLLLSVLLLLLSHVIRARRWQLLVDMLGVRSSFFTVLNAIFLNYGANLLLPRLGEIWRCIFLARKENVGFSKVVGTMLSERLVDFLTLLLILSISVFTMRNVFQNFLSSHLDLTLIPAFDQHMGYYFLFAMMGMIVLFFVFRKIRNTLFFRKVKTLARELWIGVKTLIVLPQKGRFLGLTLLLWLTYIVQIYVCFFAFDFTRHLGINVCLSLFVMGTIAFSLPVQGGIGPWHFMIISTLVYYGVGQTEAAAFALIVHTIQTLMNAVVGVFSFFVTGTSKIDAEKVKITVT